MTQVMSVPVPGAIVEILLNNQPLPAYVLEEQSGKLRLLTLKQREMNFAASRLLPWIGPACPERVSREEILRMLRQCQEKRDALVSSIDPLEIWELAQGEVDQSRVEWFAGLLKNDPDADDVAALGRALLDCKTHFKFAPPYFQVYTAEKVALRLAEIEASKERERFFTAGRTLFASLWSRVCKSGREDIPRLEPDLEDRLKRLLLTCVRDIKDQETENVWNEMKKGLPEDQNMAVLLARAWDLFPEHYNYLSDRAGYVEGDSWSGEFSGEIERLRTACEMTELPIEPDEFESVDSATTEDIDDAFRVEKLDDGSFRLLLALACPVLNWDFESSLNREVAMRVSSLYLPEGTSHMLPEALGVGLFSLRSGEPRPVLVAEVVTTPDGEVGSVDFRLRKAMIKNLTYEEVEESLNAGTAGASSIYAYELAAVLRKRRIESGAVILEQSDPVIKLKNGNGRTVVELDFKEPTPKSQLMVSEMMILANHVAALYAEKNGIALYYRTQNISLPPGSAGVWNDPVNINKAVRLLAAPLTEVRPAPHASLGVPAYAPISSPLRRYVDLINLHQIVSFIRQGKSAFTLEEMELRLPNISCRIETVGQIQRFRPRYWKLVYFRQNCKERLWRGVIVDEGPQVVTVSLPREQMIIRAHKDVFAGKAHTGCSFLVRLGRIDPLTNDVKIIEAIEE